MTARVLCLVWLAFSGCTAQAPVAFGVTMVEETECIGRGGRIVSGAGLPYCQMQD